LKVCYLYRKKHPVFFSIEKVFSQIAAVLKDQVQIDEVQMPHAKLSLYNIWQNLKAARRQQADIYHITGDIHYLALALPTRKTILTIHDCVFMYQTRGAKRWVLKKLFLTWPVRRSRLITTISERTKQDIIQFTGCSPDKVVVIPNPLDNAFTYVERTFNTACPTILFIGSTPNKNLARCIEALKGIACLLDIIGVIPDEEQRQLEKNQIQYRSVSGISSEELATKYKEADLLLFPSTFEGFGLPVIEAQQTGRAVITSNISPMSNVAGEGACLVDPYNVDSIRAGVERVIADDDYRKGIIEKGLTNVVQFDPQKIAGQYLSQYTQMTT
jgi:glycosyltransferase involved in cell wall biosynthesis